MRKRAQAWLDGLASQIRTYRLALRLIVTTAPREAILMGGLLSVQGLLAPLSVWLVKAVVDDVSRHGRIGHLVLLVSLWGFGALLAQLASQWSALLQASLNERVTAHVELLLMRKANDLPDLATFENPAFYDDLQMLRNQAPFRPMNLMVTTATLLSSFVATVGLLVLVGTLAWWLPFLLIAAMLPLSYSYVRLQQQSWSIFQKQNPLVRAMRYFVSVSTTSVYAKEVRLFNSGPYFEQRYAAVFEELRHDTAQARLKQAGKPILVVLFFVGATAFALLWTAINALVGRLSIGDLVLLLQSIVALGDKLGLLASMTSVLAGHLLFFEKLFGFLGHRSPMRVAQPGIPVLRPLAIGISFDVVSYRYPNGKLALDAVTFTIRPGERIALVGENGAGKSTLVKLLCRLYDPGAGVIRVDGIDLRELDLAGWRANFGTVFQDFGRYQLTVAENIALGREAALRDRTALDRAVHRSGFIGHIPSLRDGYETQLGVEFGGADLSGGQWQTLAIARALLTDAEILILDEPTAALDPRAEAELFRRFADLVTGKTTLLVTHRLAPVRLADRILVLKNGRLIEDGTHAELIQRNGEYATLYRSQSEQYASATA